MLVAISGPRFRTVSVYVNVCPTYGVVALAVFSSTRSAAGRYVNPPVSTPERPSGLVITTWTTPAECGGVTTEIVTESTTLTLAAGTPLRDTVAPVTKPEPIIVIAVPPSVSPEFGVTAVIEGAGV